MLSVLAHAGEPVAPHEIWGAWNLDAVVLLPVVGLCVLAISSRVRGGTARSAKLLAAAAVGLGVALVSPIDAAADSLASAHMIQHLLLTLVVGPLIAAARPGTAVLRAGPPALRITTRRVRTQLRAHGLTASGGSLLGTAAFAFLVVVAGTWMWHAAALYEAALRWSTVHALQHATFLLAGTLLWRVVLRSGHRGQPGEGLLLLFGVGLQTTLLSALMTFSPQPWYDPYVESAPLWGFDPLTDQQLAGLLMWFPTTLAGLGAAVWLVSRWLAEPGTHPDHRSHPTHAGTPWRVRSRTG